MKTSTKAIIFSIALIPTIMLVSSFTKLTTDTKYATMRTIEGGGFTALFDNKIIIAYEDGMTEEFELAKSKSSNFGENLKIINAQINVLASKGYELVSTSGTDQWTTTYSFVKK
jgi:hypothetical protein